VILLHVYIEIKIEDNTMPKMGAYEVSDFTLFTHSSEREHANLSVLYDVRISRPKQKLTRINAIMLRIYQRQHTIETDRRE